ncbi:ATP-dependent RNA helicase dhx37, partial [Physocladia obscura]
MELLSEQPEGKVSSKKRKRLEKFIQSQLKKEERVKLVKKLGGQHLEQSLGELLKSSKSLGHVSNHHQKLSAKEKLRQSLKEYKFGIPISDPNSRLFVEKEQGGDDYNDFNNNTSDDSIKEDRHEKITAISKSQNEPVSIEIVSSSGFGSSLKAPQITANLANLGTFGFALKKVADGTAVPTVVAQKKKLKKKQTKKPKTKEHKFNGVSSDEDSESCGVDSEDLNLKPHVVEQNQMKSLAKSTGPVWNTNVVEGVKLDHKPYRPPPTTIPASENRNRKPILANQSNKFYVSIVRTEEVELARMSLPIIREEQQIMESIIGNTTTILCGETGSGKTTQLPQFLYEHGFGNPEHPQYPGIIGVTQPRRVAAVSMAQRVAYEMNADLVKGPVGYQIRYDTSTVSDATRIKFMTEGILLRELSAGAESGNHLGTASGDLLLTKYSVIIIDEAHERTVGTDVLIGWLTRIAALRNSGKIIGVKPLKLVIMSATLRIEDFTGNRVLFPATENGGGGIPPVVKVDGRQFKVTVHYNRVTPETDYVSEAFKKVSKIHTKLPHGAILVFLTGQSEITTLVNRLRQAYPPKNASTSLAPAAVEAPTKLKTDTTGIFDESEDGQMFDDDTTYGREDGVDDYDYGEFLDEDDEEEVVHVLDGADGEKDDQDYAENTKETEKRENMPLYVLPLYSLLPTEAQMRVFETPPPGTRLCVVATNVAETSLTIPNVKYVVDCGKVKERRYDTHSGVQTFQIGWTSRASADQRAGRAGRVGPGHCYRLFSSAVFANYFEQFSRPEMLRVPIEGVVLQMKAMGISNVLNFPFPTPPGKENLRAGETLLIHLGAVERSSLSVETEGGGKITELGKMLSKFPVSPRYAKMLIIAADQTGYTLPYTIALVSGLSVGDPFIRDDNVLGHDGDDDDDNNDFRSKKVREWHRVMQMFSGDPPTSDALKVLRAIGAYFAAESKSKTAAALFIENHYLRPKAIEEINRLRIQLATLVKSCLTKDKIGLKYLSTPAIPPPTVQDTAILRQIMLAGYPDHIAHFDLTATKAALSTGVKNVKPVYTTMWSDKTDVFTIHASSSLSHMRPAPEWIIYEEVVGVEERLTADNSGVMFVRKDSTVAATHVSAGRDGEVSKIMKKLMLKNVTIISEDWISKIGPKSLLKRGKLLEQPAPRYDSTKDVVVGFSRPNYGPKMWELPTMEIDVDLKNAVQWFATALLEGLVKPGHVVRKSKKEKLRAKAGNDVLDMFGILLPYLVAKPSIITKTWSKVQGRVNSLLSALLSKNIASREALLKA